MKDIKQIVEAMTPEELAAQLTGIEPAKLLDTDGNFSPELAEKYLANGIGEISGIGYTLFVWPERIAELGREIQGWLDKHTRFSIPAILHEECLAGYACQAAPIFPHPIGLGCTWEPGLAGETADTARRLMLAVGARQGLAPVLDICADPRWGRCEETFGEDPYLVASFGAAYIQALQTNDLKNGVAATAKHFAGHGMSEGGRNCAPVHMGLRELRECPLFPFEAAVRQCGLRSVMSAYHELDGEPCSASSFLLNELLRGEWGFDGIVVSDYFAVEQLGSRHGVAAGKEEAAVIALEAGVDVELPYADCYGGPLLEAARRGLIPLDRLQKSVFRVLRMKEALGLFERRPSMPLSAVRKQFDDPAHIELAQRLAEKSVVMLKNENDTLPLSGNIRRLAVIGPNAANARNLLGDYSYVVMNAYWNRSHKPGGEMTLGEFSGREVISVLDGIRENAPAGMEVSFTEGCPLDRYDVSGIKGAKRMAAAADAVVIAAGDRSGMGADGTTGENIDRADIRLCGAQQDLIRAVSEAGKPTVLVVTGGKPLDLSEVIDYADAALLAWLPGERGGAAVAKVLFGEINPGGKLSVSMPRSAGTLPSGYRLRGSSRKDYLETSAAPLFPFGHGLSYTHFAYSDLSIQENTEQGYIEAAFKVRNIGNRCGDEVVQLYIRDKVASLTRPAKELKGFARIPLGAGEAKRVIFTVYLGQLAFQNRENRLVVEPGEFDVMIGASSEDIRLRADFNLKGSVLDYTGRPCFFGSWRISENT